MSIPFTQFLRPNGTPADVHITRPEEIEAKAQQIIDKGFNFECEVLSNGFVSLTIADRKKGEDVAIVIAANNEAVPRSVDRLVSSFDLSSKL